MRTRASSTILKASRTLAVEHAPEVLRNVKCDLISNYIRSLRAPTLGALACEWPGCYGMATHTATCGCGKDHNYCSAHGVRD